MRRALFFLGRYEIADGPAEHRSATSLVVRAVDHEAAEDYGELFVEFDKDSDGTLDDNELTDLAARLGTNVEILKVDEGSLTKDVFVAKCQQLFGKERKVVIKIFQVEEQWENEKKARDDQQLDARYVVQTIPAPADDQFALALNESSLFKETRFGEGVGSRAIVMDAADRNLFQIYQSERPDLNTVRVLMFQVMECVDHLHERGLVHGDIKMLNVVRLALDQKLRLIDLDAAAVFDEGDGVLYVCSKFSSAILPPECFAKLDADRVTQFEAYFKGDDAERCEKKTSAIDRELWEKVAPKVKRGVSYVVKTFQVKDGIPITDGLPYEPVEASDAVDYWSLGALLFQLVTGEPLVPSNHDDDCVDADGMAKLASWEVGHRKRRLALLADKDPSGKSLDLALKLLVRDPDERADFDINNAIKTHPFFNPQLMKDNSETLKRMEVKVDAIKADTSFIRKLSEEHRVELRRTRDVLLKGIFEVTEVNTPTCFVVLTEELPTLDAEQKSWIQEHVVVKEDGSGVEIKGNTPAWYADVEARFKDGMGWAEKLATFEPEAALTSKSFLGAIKAGFKSLLPTTTLYFYLVDEVTGLPVEGDGYPIEITEPSEQVSKLLPVMQVGMHAMSAYQGVAGVARMFGYPLPMVPEAWRKGAQSTVDLLKQKSSVAAFGAVHEKVKDKDEANQTVRGASLRELKRFFEEHSEAENYAGLRRIGDPNDGTAVWTTLDEKDVDTKLAERAEQRRTEAEISRKQNVKALMAKAAGGGDAGAVAGGGEAGETGGATAAVTTATTTAPAAGGGPAAARALATNGDSEALRRVVGIEDRLAGLEARLRGMDNWNY